MFIKPVVIQIVHPKKINAEQMQQNPKYSFIAQIQFVRFTATTKHSTMNNS